MHDRALHDPCVFVCVCANKTCVSAERYEVHLTKAPVTDVHGNAKYRLGVTQTHREMEGRRVMKGEDDETKERIEQTLGELFTLYYYMQSNLIHLYILISSLVLICGITLHSSL